VLGGCDDQVVEHLAHQRRHVRLVHLMNNNINNTLSILPPSDSPMILVTLMKHARQRAGGETEKEGGKHGREYVSSRPT
jgi:hypothetical protein